MISTDDDTLHRLHDALARRAVELRDEARAAFWADAATAFGGIAPRLRDVATGLVRSAHVGSH